MKILSSLCDTARGYLRLHTNRHDSRDRRKICTLHRISYTRQHEKYSKETRICVQDVYNIATLDSAPEWTLDQIAGLVFASLLVTLYYSSKIVDEYVAFSQRIDLGICGKCGGLNDETTCQEKECPCRT